MSTDFFRKGTTGPTVIVTSDLDNTGNFVFESGVDNPTLTIEAAWSYLNDIGGGTLVTKGSGETWIVETTVNSQGDDVKWVSDWGLTLQTNAALNSEIVRIQHSNVILDGLRFDGNSGGQTNPDNSDGVSAYGSYGAEVYNVHIRNCYFYDIRRFGIMEYHIRDYSVRDCYFNGSGYNAIQGWLNVSRGIISNNIIEHYSDVGINTISTTYEASYVNIINNIIHDMDGTIGYNNAGWGISHEATTRDCIINGNVIYNCKMGIVTSNTSYNKSRVLISDNVIYNISNDFPKGIWLQKALDCIVANNIIDTSVDGIESTDSSDCIIQGNRIRNCTTPINVNNASCIRPMIISNNWEGCTNDASTAAATNERITCNIDKNGAWWATGDAPN